MSQSVMPSPNVVSTLIVCGDHGNEQFTKPGNGRRAASGIKIESGAKYAEVVFKNLLAGRFSVHTMLSQSPTVEDYVFTVTGHRRNGHVALRLEDSAAYVRHDIATVNPITDLHVATDLDAADYLYIHDMGGGWRSLKEETQAFKKLRKLLDHLKKRGGLRVVVNVCGSLPQTIDRDGQTEFVDPVWKLLEEYRQHVCVMCSCTQLRHAGAAISRRLSWELTIEDLATDLILFKPIRVLSRFQNLIVRFGHVGAIALQSVGGSRSANFVFAPMTRDGIFRDPVEDGKILDKDVLVGAGLFRELQLEEHRSPNGNTAKPAAAQGASTSIKYFSFREREAIWKGTQRGLVGAMGMFQEGYPDPARYPASDPSSGDAFLHAFVAPAVVRFVDDVFVQPFGDPDTVCCVAIPCGILSRPPGSLTNPRSTWEILRDQMTCCSSSEAFDSTPQLLNDQISRINVGIAIVKYGLNKVLNREFSPAGNMSPADLELDREIVATLRRPECVASREEPRDHITLAPHALPLLPEPSVGSLSDHPFEVRSIYAPTAEFAKLKTVERHDIEGIRSIRNLIKRYMEHQGKDRNERDKPISLAVFGPPGTGKSFAVKQVIDSINHGQQDSSIKLRLHEVNMSQCRKVADLEKMFRFIHDMKAKREMPVIFIDEFDCDFEDHALGWLKYFLAPMQDGVFHTLTGELHVGGAVFIFAGGIYSRFSEFDPSEPPGIDRHPPDTAEHRSRVADFKARKGPDFVSRLQGHLNIMAIDCPEGQTKPIIRRALVLRASLMQHGFTNFDQLAGNGRRVSADDCVARVDEDLIYAMLTVDRYRHGVRSMEAILRMCSPIHKTMLKASLPSRVQLNMHVDADEFFIRMYRARARRQPNGGIADSGSTPATPMKRRSVGARPKVKSRNATKLNTPPKASVQATGEETTKNQQSEV